MNNYKPLASIYRPKTLEEFVGQELVVNYIKRSVKENKLHHSYIFSGSYGIGKTSFCRVFAKSMLCQEYNDQVCYKCKSCLSFESSYTPDYIEMNAGKHTRIDELDKFLDCLNYKPVFGKYRILVIDEAHMLSVYAFNSLLKIMEEPQEHIKIILSTTKKEKIPDTILSRCVVFFLNKITPLNIQIRLEQILNIEKIDYDKKAIEIISINCNGSMRQAINTLEYAILARQESISINLVNKIIGYIDQTILEKIFEIIIKQDINALMDKVQEILNQNIDHIQVCNSMSNVIYNKYLDNIKQEKDLSFNKKLKQIYKIIIEDIKIIKLAQDKDTALKMFFLTLYSYNQNDQYKTQTYKNIDIVKNLLDKCQISQDLENYSITVPENIKVFFNKDIKNIVKQEILKDKSITWK